MVFKVSWSQHPFTLLCHIRDRWKRDIFDRSNTQSTHTHQMGFFERGTKEEKEEKEDYPTKKKESSSSTTTTTGSEEEDVVDASISKGRAMLEHMKSTILSSSSSSSSSSSTTTTTTMPLKTLNVPSMKTREADVLVLEEKVSRVTNELNAAIREKGVVKMQLEEVNAEMLLAQTRLKDSEAKKEEMTLRHERAAKAILGLEKRAEEAEEKIEQMKRQEEKFKEDIVELRRTRRWF